MKQILFILFCLFSISTFGQLKVRGNSARINNIELKYDSLSNITLSRQDNLKQYIGQDIVFMPRHNDSDLNIYNYATFIKEQPDTIWIKNRKGKKKVKEGRDFILDYYYKSAYIKDQVVFMGNYASHYGYNSIKVLTGYYTPSYEIEGRKFHIENISKVKHALEHVIFSLVDSDNNRFSWDVTLPSFILSPLPLPVYIDGYIKKITDMLVNKRFIIPDYSDKYFNTINSFNALDLSTLKGSRIVGEVEVYDIVLYGLKNNFLVPQLLLRDNKNNEYSIDLTEAPSFRDYLLDGSIQQKETFGFHKVFNKYDLDLFIPYETYHSRKKQTEEEEKISFEKKMNRLIKTYGKETAMLMLLEKVEIGWTKEMCIEALGLPEDVNTSIGAWGEHEQWVYPNSIYLYFENGILTSIQQ